MAIQFTKATKEQCRLRLALIGVSGGGKTFTALTLAKHFGGKTVVLDSERKSASKYADLFDFDTFNLESGHPNHYIEAIKAAGDAGYSNIIIDSLSHAWVGKDGALELMDKVSKRSGGKESFTGWKEVNPILANLLDVILTSPAHVLATLRAKMEYVIERDERTGKNVPRKVGLQPVFRDQLEFEFDVVADMDQSNNMIITKTRCVTLTDGVFGKPGKEVADILMGWVNAGAAPKPSTPQSNTTALANSTAAGSNETAGGPVGTTEKKQTAQTAGTPTAQNANAAKTETTSGEKPAGSAAPGGKDAAPSQSSSASAKDAPPPNSQKVEAEQMQQLLKAGEDNGWSMQAISQFVCHAFKLTPKTVGQITWQQWETAVKIVSQKENAGGKVVVTAQGKALEPAQCWPPQGA